MAGNVQRALCRHREWIARLEPREPDRRVGRQSNATEAEVPRCRDVHRAVRAQPSCELLTDARQGQRGISDLHSRATAVESTRQDQVVDIQADRRAELEQGTPPYGHHR